MELCYRVGRREPAREFHRESRETLRRSSGLCDAKNQERNRPFTVADNGARSITWTLFPRDGGACRRGTKETDVDRTSLEKGISNESPTFPSLLPSPAGLILLPTCVYSDESAASSGARCAYAGTSLASDSTLSYLGLLRRASSSVSSAMRFRVLPPIR